MNEKKPLDIVKEVAWNLLVYVLYYIYCFVMLMIFHFIAYRVIDSLDWEIRDIAAYALIAATIAMIVRIIRLVRKGN